MTKSLGKKTVNFDMNGIASSSRRQGGARRAHDRPHDSYVEDNKTGTRIPVELTRGDVFEVSAHVSFRPRSLLENPVLICPK